MRVEETNYVKENILARWDEKNSMDWNGYESTLNEKIQIVYSDRTLEMTKGDLNDMLAMGNSDVVLGEDVVKVEKIDV